MVSARLEQLRTRLDVVIDALRNDLPEWSFAPVRGGLSVWVRLPDDASATAFVAHASRYGVSIASGREFCPNDVDCPNIRIPFTAPREDLLVGMKRLAEAWQTFDRSPVERLMV